MKYNSLIEVITTFADNKVCIDYLTQMRWKDGKVNCVHCNHDKVYELKGANKRFKCSKCRGQFSATKGSIFENSPVSLQKWFIALYIHTSHKKGISSHQLAKDIDVTQKTAWFMLHRLRFALQTGSFEHKEDGIIEVDETFVGGKEKNKHQSVKTTKMPTVSLMTAGKPFSTWKDKKVAVLGLMERDGSVTAKVVPNVQEKTLLPFIKENVSKGAIVMTDEYLGYHSLNDLGYVHQTVKHSAGEYVRGNVHTNGIENFWSQFKRGIYGVYHHCSPKHLNSYIDEFEYRFNTRKISEAQRFQKCVSLSSKRLTYKDLIAHNGKESKPIITA